jgi:hypothetical protein
MCNDDNEKIAETIFDVEKEFQCQSDRYQTEYFLSVIRRKIKVLVRSNADTTVFGCYSNHNYYF